MNKLQERVVGSVDEVVRREKHSNYNSITLAYTHIALLHATFGRRKAAAFDKKYNEPRRYKKNNIKKIIIEMDEENRTRRVG